MQNVKIIVSFYNEIERKLIEQHIPKDLWFHNGDNEIVVEIPFVDFMTFMMFQFQDARLDRSTFAEISQIVENNWKLFGQHFRYNPLDGRFTSMVADNNEINFISEFMGVGTALSVVSTLIPDLHHADWIRIPRNDPGLDFNYDAVSIGKRFVVEAKGTISPDNTNREILYGPYGRIKRQKGAIENNEDFNNSVLLGLIGAADPNNYLRAFIVDPPIENYKGDLRKLKLLKRLYYYHYFLQLISPRSNITVALANRILAIEQTNEFEKFHNIPLVNAKFNKYEITRSFFYNKTSNFNNNYFGKLHSTKDNNLIYIGLTTDVLQILIDQNFNYLLNYKAQSHFVENETFNCTLNLSSNNNKTFIEENNLQDKIEKRRNKAKFTLNAEHHLSLSGLNFFRSNSQQIEYMNTISKYRLF